MIEELTPPPNRRLCRAGDVGVELGQETQDFRVLVDQVSDAFVQRLNRTFAKTAVRETFPTWTNRPLCAVLLALTPVEDVTLVTGADGLEIDPLDYDLDNELGLLTFRVPQRAHAMFAAKVVVEYTGGFVLPDWPGQTSTLPPSIERAAIEATKAVYEVRQGGSDVSREGIGDYSVSYRTPGQAVEAHLAAVAGFRPDRGVLMLAELWIGNDQVIEVSGVTDPATGAFVNDAVVTATIRDSGGDVLESGIPLDYVTGSNGDYRGVLEEDLPLVDRDFYTIDIRAEAPGDLVRSWRFTRQARYRQP